MYLLRQNNDKDRNPLYNILIIVTRFQLNYVQKHVRKCNWSKTTYSPN